MISLLQAMELLVLVTKKVCSLIRLNKCLMGPRSWLVRALDLERLFYSGTLKQKNMTLIPLRADMLILLFKHKKIFNFLNLQRFTFSKAKILKTKGMKVTLTLQESQPKD